MVSGRVALLGGLSVVALALSACGADSDTAATAAAPATTIAAITPAPAPTPTPTPTPAPATPTPAPPAVSATLIAALDVALDDERKAEATYSAIIQAFGPVAPFVNIIEAERQHIAMLIELYRTRGLDVPANTWEGRGVAGASVADSCRTGVTAEIENVEIYDRLLASITDLDVRSVFLALQAASRDKHLPAFQACAS